MAFRFEHQEDVAGTAGGMPLIQRLPDGRSALVCVVISALDHERCVVSFTEAFRMVLAVDLSAQAATADHFARMIREAIVDEMQKLAAESRGGN